MVRQQYSAGHVMPIAKFEKPAVVRHTFDQVRNSVKNRIQLACTQIQYNVSTLSTLNSHAKINVEEPS